ncbi:MAG: N-acetylneuraminate synthase [Deltaproteobacteria bacterium RIFOXYB12_FULL_58_9]|nr:MAG: N-acetylneuraminate synthase [Deltaproteobacteria bacterium RIFOXYB12_FULL_58_9]
MSQRQLRIGRVEIGPGHPLFLVGEVGQAHDGSLGTAHAYVDAIAAAGATAVKFQTHIAAAESTAREPFRVRFSPQDNTRYEYWQRMEFTEEQWNALARHAEERGLVFLSSPFSEAAVDLLERIGVLAWKIGAGEIRSRPLLERMARTGKPILLSTGMASWMDLQTAVEWLRPFDVPFGVYQCTTAYPCPPEKWGLNILHELRSRFLCPVGFSDHSGTIAAGLAAAALGADMLEVHVTLSRESFGPDVVASITTSELGQLADGVGKIRCAIQNPIDKDAMASQLEELHSVFGKSIVAARLLVAGHVVTLDDMAYKKPGTGIPARRAADLLGRKVKRELAADDQINNDDLE